MVVKCEHCGLEYRLLRGAPNACPARCTPDNLYLKRVENMLDSSEYMLIRNAYMGKVIDGALIVDILDIDTAEFMTLPEHNLYVVPIEKLFECTLELKKYN